MGPKPSLTTGTRRLAKSRMALLDGPCGGLGMHDISLKIRGWAAIQVANGNQAETIYGADAPAQAGASGIWRRMGRLERLAVRCTLSVLEGLPTGSLIFCSRHGSVETLVAMLSNVAAGELLSPMAFSGSVHNAAPGMVGQIRNERLSHTALSAGTQTFAAGLTEASARLMSGEGEDVTLTFAELPIPDPFDVFDDEHLPGLALALRLALSQRQDVPRSVQVSPGRRGVFALLDALKDGASDLTLGGISWPAHAH